MPSKSLADKDLSRGKRLSKILDTFFPGKSRRAVCRELGIGNHSRLQNMENGSSIENKVLGKLLDVVGMADVVWLLTGKKPADNADRPTITPNQVLSIKILSEMMEVENKLVEKARERMGVLLEALRGVAMDPEAADQFIADRDEVALLDVLRRSNSQVRNRQTTKGSAKG